MEEFLEKSPSVENYWRGIVLFGRNVACYKFALAKALLEIRPRAGELVKLEELAPVYSGHVAEHLRKAAKQTTSPSSKFLEACRLYNTGEISAEKLNESTLRYGFNHVIDAFHVVGRGDIAKRFFVDERKQHGGLRITDEFEELLNGRQAPNLPFEVEARWRLVETAWSMGLSRSLVTVTYDQEDQHLIVGQSSRRRSVAGSREALNGYQKGRCFYCFDDIEVSDPNSDAYAEVDHFFPHVLKTFGVGSIVDGVWNLVLSCRNCNRGANGKFDSVPTLRLLERLHRRNEFLISSHHPLRETIMFQTGNKEPLRRMFLNNFYNEARALLLHTWETEEKREPTF